MRPVYKSRAEALDGIKSGPPQDLKSPGKIFLRGDYLFINEVDKGVHVFDNSAPASPKGVAFISIPGNMDIGLKGDILYGDMYQDLVLVDISNPLQVKLSKTVRNVFPHRNYGTGLSEADNGSWIITGWIEKDTTVDISAAENNIWSCPNCTLASSDVNGSKSGAVVPGIGGSMARFSIVNNYLYAVQLSTLGVYDISDPENIQIKKSPMVGMAIETIYPFNNKLFIGSGSGMFIFNLNNPSEPQKEGMFSHASACDPVIADDEYAFVTLRTGNSCMGSSDELDVIDIKNAAAPELIKAYQMVNPHGLAKEGDLLFVCDGEDGLKIFDASDVKGLRLIKHLKGMEAYDVIAWDNKLIMVASNGLYQYDYSNPQDIRLLSTIAASR